MDATPGGSGSATVMSAEDRAALVSAIKANACIIVLGNTGCGKTTQLPQLLLQAGFGPVCVTQPRRVAAVAAARRVARERRVEVGTEVGFAIRFEQACDTSTRIKFVTDGVLLREAVAQPALPQYGSLVLDEAHERSLNTDVLLSIAKRILAGLHSAAAGQPRPGPQRLVVSSATLDASRFAFFFLGAPVVQVSSRSFPVTVHHVAKPITSDTARLEAALELAMRVHTQRPAGPNQDVLLFLAGQDDIATATHAARTLAAELSATRPGLPQLLVLPLHSSVASADQARVLARPPEHTRRLIVATNIAETSLTIPGVSVVIDTGVAKEKRYQSDKGMEVLSVVPISRSSAVQRAGRAGRTGPGEVWRLYTEEQMAGFLQAPIPEIQRTNLAAMVLSLKQMGVDKPEQLDWLDPPEPSALQQAMRQLFLLDALDRHSRLTPCGASMARLPLEPCLAKTMLCAVQSGCAPTAAAMCALVYGEDVFCRAGPEPLKQAAQEARKRYEAAEGDHTTLLNVFEEWATVAPTHREAWCSRRGLHARALRAASDVRAQLLSLLDRPPAAVLSQGEGHRRGSPAGGTGAHSEGNEEGRRPNGGGPSSPRTRRLCRQAICEGHFMHAARRAHASRAFVTLAEPAQTVFPRQGNEALLDTASHVVFSELAWHGRLVMRHACAVEPEWLQHLLPRLKEPMADSVGFRDGGAAQQAAGGMPRPAAAEAPSLVRRNDANAVAAAQQRFEQRRKRLKSERVG